MEDTHTEHREAHCHAARAISLREADCHTFKPTNVQCEQISFYTVNYCLFHDCSLIFTDACGDNFTKVIDNC